MAKKPDIAFSVSKSGKFEMLPVDQLENFPNHPFKKYAVEQLDRVFHNVIKNKDNVDQPIIVRRTKVSDKFQILSGHNRTEATKRAGLPTIPAIVYDELSDYEAVRIVNESNIAQRTLENWLPSEKARSIGQYYESVKSQGKRFAEGENASGEVNQRWDARKKTAEVYNIGENVVRTFLRLNELIDPLKDRMDGKEYGLTPAKNLSWLPVKVQELINSILDEDDADELYKVNLANSKKLKSSFGKCNVECLDVDRTIEQIRFVLTPSEHGAQEELTSDEPMNILFPADLYIQLFQNEKNNDKIVGRIKMAMEYLEKHHSTQKSETA